MGKANPRSPQKFHARVFGRALVTFGDGASIADITFRSDYSTLALYNIPIDIAPDQLRTELQSFFKCQILDIWDKEFDTETWRRSGLIRIADAGVASKTAVDSGGRKKIKGSQMEFEAVQLSPSFSEYYRIYPREKGKKVNRNPKTWVVALKGAWVTIRAAVSDRIKLNQRMARLPRFFDKGKIQEAIPVFCLLKHFPANYLDDGPAQQTTDSSSPICSVDWQPAQDPITTSCGHIYCSPCLHQQAASTTRFPLRCLGATGECNRPLPIDELEQHLSEQDFKHLLWASLQQYLRNHPGDYHYCPTPSCLRFYRVSKPEFALSFKCDSCRASTCTTCHEPWHRGISCAEALASSDGTALFSAWKKRNDVRDCPRCSAPIQKGEGCHTVTCAACQISMCWVCMKTYESLAGVYMHLVTQHAVRAVEVAVDEEHLQHAVRAVEAAFEEEDLEAEIEAEIEAVEAELQAAGATEAELQAETEAARAFMDGVMRG